MGLLFRMMFGEDKENFRTTEEVDEFLEEKLGKKIGIVKVKSPFVVPSGNIYNITKIDIEEMVDSDMEKIERWLSGKNFPRSLK